MEIQMLAGLVLCVAGAALADQSGAISLDGVRGPEPLTSRDKRTVIPQNYNSDDCPPSWRRPISIPAQMPCPPGQVPSRFSGRPHLWGYNRPCPPWMDAGGRCHVEDQTLEADRCLELAGGEDALTGWRANALLSQPPGPPGPKPTCRPGRG